MFKPTFLYIKTHNKTGLKYFGKTISSDPFKYRGSGTYWTAHLKKYGNDVTTEIIGLFIDKDFCEAVAVEFSKLNDVVRSTEWANLCIENGTNVGTDQWRGSLTLEQTQELNAKKARPGKLNGMFGVSRKGKDAPGYGRQCTQRTKDAASKANKGKCVVRDAETGEFIGQVSVDHPNVKNGKWCSVVKGRKASPETRQKLSESRKGRAPPSQKGVPKTERWKRVIKTIARRNQMDDICFNNHMSWSEFVQLFRETNRNEPSVMMISRKFNIERTWVRRFQENIDSLEHAWDEYWCG